MHDLRVYLENLLELNGDSEGRSFQSENVHMYIKTLHHLGIGIQSFACINFGCSFLWKGLFKVEKSVKLLYFKNYQPYILELSRPD